MKRLLATTMVFLLVAVGYLVADIRDIVPGFLTQRPVVQDGPLPTAPAATIVAASPTTTPTTAPPLPNPSVLAKQVAPYLAAPAMGTGPALVVYDAATGNQILGIRQQVPLVPASSAKTLTAIAALSRFGPNAQLPTSATLNGKTVTLVGGGDIFLSPTKGSGTSARGFAGLADLADQTASSLKAKHLTNVVLRLDDTLIAGIWNKQPANPGWDPSDIGNGFASAVSAIAINAGRLTPDEYAKRVPDPGLAAAQVFATRLKERGITVTGAPARGRSAAKAVQLGVIWSAPMQDVISLVLQTSDNNGADVLAKLVAVSRGVPPTGPGGGAAVLSQLGTLGINGGGVRLVDGSGLAKGSTVSAAVLAETVLLAADGKHPHLAPLLAGLPTAGLTGTLVKRFAQPQMAPAQGRVRAKTGTLTGTSTLTGYVRDRSGRLLVFSVMTGPTPAATVARTSIDQIVTTLAGCGCR